MTTHKLTLNPIDGRASFYNKCHIIDDGHIAKLQSYDTIVAEYHHDTKEVKIFGWYSKTTARHIRSFLYYFNVPYAETITKRQMEDFATNSQ